MKFKKTDLVAALKTASLVRPEYVAIYSKNGGLRINAAGRGFGGVVAQANLPSEDLAVQEASFQVPFDRFRAIVESMPGDTVTIVLGDKDGAHVASGRTRLRVSAVYDPAIDEINAEAVSQSDKFCVFEGEVLSGAIALVSHAMAENDMRFFLNGMHINVRDGGDTEVVATNGHRLVINRIQAKSVSGAFRATLAPAAVHLLKSMSADGDVKLSIIDKTLIAKRGDWLCRMALYSEYIKDYDKVIPRDHGAQFEVSRLEFAAAFHRVMLADEDRKHKAVVVKSGDPGVVAITLGSDPTSCDEIGVQQCAPFEYGVNGSYVEEFLSACRDEKVQVSIKDMDRMIIAPVGTKDVSKASYATVIMGMRV